MDILGKDVPGTSNALPELAFCSKWNPEFTFNGHHCCGKGARGSRKKRRMRCSLERAKGTYCGEITPEQEEYTLRAQSGALGDILELISSESTQKSAQSYCTVNNGFLAWGRRLIPSEQNKIVLRAPNRCTEFGTDSMIGMLEWLGREVARDYSGPEYENTHLVIGDVSAPRGGCLSGTGGRRGHLSHTTGQDVDISFLSAKEGAESPVSFHRQFDARQNWYLLKKILKNPFACVKVVFLDRRLISKLARVAGSDEDWINYHRFVRHMPGHRNHFHVRIGEGPGQPGCAADANPELELDEIGDDPELDLTEQADDILNEIQLSGGR
jgi:murein endopeptidase